MTMNYLLQLAIDSMLGFVTIICSLFLVLPWSGAMAEEVSYRLILIDASESGNDNLIRLECRLEDNSVEQNAFFWLNGISLFDREEETLTRTLRTIGQGIQFTITPDTEGSYTCGVQTSMNRIESEPKIYAGMCCLSMVVCAV